MESMPNISLIGPRTMLVGKFVFYCLPWSSNANPEEIWAAIEFDISKYDSGEKMDIIARERKVTVPTMEKLFRACGIKLRHHGWQNRIVVDLQFCGPSNPPG